MLWRFHDSYAPVWPVSAVLPGTPSAACAPCTNGGTRVGARLPWCLARSAGRAARLQHASVWTRYQRRKFCSMTRSDKMKLTWRLHIRQFIVWSDITVKMQGFVRISTLSFNLQFHNNAPVYSPHIHVIQRAQGRLISPSSATVCSTSIRATFFQTISVGGRFASWIGGIALCRSSSSVVT